MRVRLLRMLASAVILISLSLPPTSAAVPYPAPVSSQRAEGVFLVRFHDLPAPTIDALNRQFGVQSLGVIPGIRVHKLAAPPGRTVDEMIAAYRSLRDVVFAEPDYFAQIADTIPNDALFPDQWAPRKIQLPAAWDLFRGNATIVVAVIDTGVDWSHPDLQGQLLPGADFTTRRGTAQDDNGHGTHVTGIVGALTDNTMGVAGVDWQVRILPVKVLGSGGFGTYDAVAEGIVYAADHGAQVVNLSLGGSSPSETLRAAVEYAWSRNVFLACAAGNTNGPILFPAAYPGCTAVAATDGTDQRAAFSSYGPQAALAAPGVGVLSTVPTGSCTFCDPTGYRSLSGTSMATPYVAGVAALLIGHFQPVTNAEVRNQLAAQADDLGTSGWDMYFGYGRINAYRAIANPLSPPVPPPPLPPLAAALAWPPDGSTVSGWVKIDVTASGGLPPYRVVVTVEGKKTKTLCDITSAEGAIACYWNTTRGWTPGPYRIVAAVADGRSQVTDAVAVTLSR